MKLLSRTIRMIAVFAFMGLAGSAFAADTTPDPKDLALNGDAKCTRCHDESEKYPVLTIAQTRHGVRADSRTPSCTSCHGASEKHLGGNKDGAGRPSPDVIFRKGTYKPSEVDNRAGACLSCHQGGNRLHWTGSQHQAKDMACTSCHQIHVKNDPVMAKQTQRDVCFNCHKTERAETHRVSTHPIQAGKVGCSDCHNPHGSEGPKLMKEITVRDTCFTCHAEKRGPFLWEHPSAMDDCMNCHTPHGSTNAPLLRARAPWLCQGCHGDGAPHPGNIYSAAQLPGGAVANVNTKSAVANVINPVTGQGINLNNPPPQLAFRGCTNCHTQVHGSNAPGGKRFVR
jgi:DmsE family decaheme c-type cytochrome